MSDGRDVIYLYDGSFEGLLSAIFEAIEKRETPLEIKEDKNIQRALFIEYINITTDFLKSERLFNSICKFISHSAWRNVYYTYLSDRDECGRLCLDYIKSGFYFGKSVDEHLNIDSVIKVLNAVKRVENEAHLYKGFVRFKELKENIYYSEIEPKCNILPIISKHFKERLPNIPWLIHDTKRCLCLVYDGKSCYIRETENLPKAEYSEAEEYYQALWKEFYKKIEIKERHNERCRMTHMPKRFWKNITEMQQIFE